MNTKSPQYPRYIRRFPFHDWLLLALISCINLPAASYYVSNAGNDANAGTSTTTSWATLSKVNSFAFAPGDIVQFKAGDVWRGALVPATSGVNSGGTGYITFKSYSTGAKPKLLGSVTPGAWTSLGSNKWRSATNQCPLDVGNLIFNDGAAFGFKKASLAELTKQDDFWYDASNQAVVMYSTQSPDTRYVSIECALRRLIINVGGRNYIKINGLAVSYGGSHGIWGSGCTNIVINACDISYMGGSYLTGTLRYGNGIEFYNAASNCTVTNNYIRQIYDTGITNQGDTGSQSDLFYQNNTIENCEWSYEIWGAAASTIQRVYFENNICRYAGSTWAYGQRPVPSGAHLQFAFSEAQSSNIFIRYNTFYGSTRIHVDASYSPTDWNGFTNVIIDYNHYYQTSGNFSKWNHTIYGIEAFSTYKAISGKDANSILN